jgi:Tol biopolymer transport system component
VLLVLLTMIAAGLPAPAWATSPGQAGALVVVRAGDLYRVGVADGAAKRLTQTRDARRPRWSPDGQRIAFTRAGDVWVVQGDGTGAVRVAAGVGAGGPTWSPDGRWIAYLGGDARLWKVRSTAPYGAPVPLLPGPHRVARRDPSTVEQLATDTSIAWSPDGSAVAFPGGDCLAVYDRCLTVADVRTGTQRLIAGYGGGGQGSGFAVLPSWAPDGRSLTLTAYQQPGEEPGVPVHVAECVGAACQAVGRSGDREGVPSPVIGADDLVVSRWRAGVLYVVLVSRSGRPDREIATGGQPDWQPLRP